MESLDESGPRSGEWRPSRFLRFLFNLPAWFYRRGWGWILGSRVLAVTHRGRKTGKEFHTILEAMSFDRQTGESVVASAYGPGADWYQNIRIEPALRVTTGRLDYQPQQRFLTESEAREAADRFCREHPLEARLIPRVLSAIGAAIPTDRSLGRADLLATLPMVAFRPKT